MWVHFVSRIHLQSSAKLQSFYTSLTKSFVQAMSPASLDNNLVDRHILLSMCSVRDMVEFLSLFLLSVRFTVGCPKKKSELWYATYLPHWFS